MREPAMPRGENPLALAWSSPSVWIENYFAGHATLADGDLQREAAILVERKRESMGCSMQSEGPDKPGGLIERRPVLRGSFPGSYRLRTSPLLPARLRSPTRSRQQIQLALHR